VLDGILNKRDEKSDVNLIANYDNVDIDENKSGNIIYFSHCKSIAITTSVVLF